MKNKEEIFLKIYKSNKDRIYRICHYYVSDKELVNDLFQEILTNIWGNLERFRGNANIDTWIYRIAINTSISFVKLVKRECKRKRHIEEVHHGNPLIQDESKEEIESKIQLLYKGIAQLSIAEKTIISLVIEDASYKEIAKICNISEGTLRVRIHRIKKKLQLILKDNIHEI